MLFTHRGLSGPAVLQISSYWEPGDSIVLNMAPGHNIADAMKADRTARPRVSPAVWLTQFIPARLCKSVPGLYFIGEVVDVTGHLGGHNFQWAWASGVAAGAAC